MREWWIFVPYFVGSFWTPAALAGCCNDNFWCDGDPSFNESPDVYQEEYSKKVTISWNEAHIHLSKCVDYFYVEYAIVDNGTDDVEGLQYSIAPVSLQRKKLSDRWEDSLKPFLIKYSAEITVDYDTKYVIRAVAVDKGAGWGEYEGHAIVFSKPVRYRTRVFTKKPDPEEVATMEFVDKYPPSECGRRIFCEQFAREWTDDVVDYVIEHSLTHNDPQYLPPVKVYTDGDEMIYEEGRLSNIRNAVGEVRNVSVRENQTDFLTVEIVFKFRLLRSSYLWHNFISKHTLSMYYTCGQNLPLAIFNDPDEEYIEEVIKKGCRMTVNVAIKVPHNVTSSTKRLPEIVSIFLEGFEKKNFKFDVTWITENLHDLESLWRVQSEVVKEALIKLMERSLKRALISVDTEEWIERKFSGMKNMTVNGTNVISLYE